MRTIAALVTVYRGCKSERWCGGPSSGTLLGGRGRWRDCGRSQGRPRVGRAAWECPRLARGIVTLVATRGAASRAKENAHGLSVGSLRSSLESGVVPETNVRLPQASRGHLGRLELGRRGSSEREAPTGKPWASRPAASRRAGVARKGGPPMERD